MSLTSFVHDIPAPRVIFGAGHRSQVPDEVARLEAQRVLVIGDDTLVEMVQEIADAVAGRLAGTFCESVRHIPIEVARRAVAAARDADADLLVAVGGGSCIGTAKVVARELDLPILAVPTSHTGSEMTPIWALTENQVKNTARDQKVLPATVVYDPELTLSLPPQQAGNSGMNAMAHLVESMYSPVASPISMLMAQEGIRALAAGLPRVVEDPTDIKARSLAMYGGWLGGWVLGTTTMSVHHTITRVIGGTYDTPHGATHSAVLPYVTMFNSLAANPAMRTVKRALGQASRPAPRAGVGLWELARDIGATTSLRALGLPESAVDEITEQVVAASPPNPRPLTRSGLRNLLEAAYRGERPTDIED